MSFQWNFIAGFLYLEIGLVLLFVVPIISPRKWQRIFNSGAISRVTKYSAMYFYIYLAILILFLVDAVRDIKKYSNSASDSVSYASEMKGSIRLFRAQRNFYITFFAIYLSFVLRRLISMIDTQATLINKSEAIIKEAEHAKNLACKTVRDHENMLTIEKKTQDDVVNALNEQIEELMELQKMEQEKYKILRQEYEVAITELGELREQD